MKRLGGIAIWIAMALTCTGTANAVAPAGVTFQGVALAPEGSPLAGAHDVVLRLFSDPVSAAAGELRYEESHDATSFVDGVFSVVIGTGTSAIPFDAHLFAEPDLWLEVEIDGERMSPRSKLQSVAYALQCANAETVGGTPALDLIRDVAAGEGLVGGTVSGSATLSVDFTQTQRRVAASCPAGSSIRQINADGSVACESDDAGGTGDITGVATVFPLTGGGTSGNVSISIASEAIGGNYIADNAITSAKILNGTIGSGDIGPGQVGSPQIADGSIQGIDLADGGILAPDLSDESVTSAKVRDGSLVAGDLRDEPGADFDSSVGGFALGSSDSTSVASVAISAPAAGIVVVNVSATLTMLDEDSAYCEITSGSERSNEAWVSGQAAGRFPIALTYAFEVPAGVTTFELECIEDEAGDVVVWVPTMTAMYFPTRY